MTVFRDRYRVESARLQGRDYAETGMYFITACTHGRYPWFGEIRNGVMGLSDAGCVVHQFWSDIPSHFPHVALDEFVVMPNHVHGILTLKRAPYGFIRRVCTSRIRRPTPGSVGSIIGQWKTACTKHIRCMGCPDFAWQPRFHDHIIQSERALDNIRSYIRNNPRMWKRDRNHMH